MHLSLPHLAWSRTAIGECTIRAPAHDSNLSNVYEHSVSMDARSGKDKRISCTTRSFFSFGGGLDRVEPDMDQQGKSQEGHRVGLGRDLGCHQQPSKLPNLTVYASDKLAPKQTRQPIKSNSTVMASTTIFLKRNSLLGCTQSEQGGPLPSHRNPQSEG